MTKAEVHELCIELAESTITCAGSEDCQHASLEECLAAAFEPYIWALVEALERISDSAEKPYHVTTGDGHARCIELARAALDSVQKERHADR